MPAGCSPPPATTGTTRASLPVSPGRRTSDTRRDLVVRQLVDLYGPQASTPIDYLDHRWGAEPFAPGGPHPVAGPHTTVSYGRALTEPHGRIHWAGTETAGEWAGTMNGAVLTGWRTAENVAALLSRDVREGASR
ncbi:FAD-dependent oxidoreductase [Kitasatospora sp. NPDC096128]|uniref:flavin monoamine oxidase family protein n=1 Tax=Kitasatospora sp. NPDC096128 TaxID=3155547 RepID=UPI00331F5067